ncbi:MAG: hypothetical protein J0L55_08235 [Caulobacterales bacterium]|nr:hypothetical protein [Caulobacterales bacterium]MCA0373291.1 hypothetical protein [Pseudomonadota bacterium]
MSVQNAIDAIYESLKQDNLELDSRIKELKDAMNASGEKTAMFDTNKIAQNNRQGRKLMQSYFKQKGVKIDFLK